MAKKQEQKQEVKNTLISGLEVGRNIVATLKGNKLLLEIDLSEETYENAPFNDNGNKIIATGKDKWNSLGLDALGLNITLVQNQKRLKELKKEKQKTLAEANKGSEDSRIDSLEAKLDKLLAALGGK